MCEVWELNAVTGDLHPVATNFMPLNKLRQPHLIDQTVHDTSLTNKTKTASTPAKFAVMLQQDKHGKPFDHAFHC